VLTLLRAYTPFTALLLVVSVLLLFSGSLVSPAPLDARIGGPLYRTIVEALPTTGRAVWSGGFAILILLAEALYLNHLAIRRRLLPKATYLPAACFILLCAFLIPRIGLSPYLVASALLLPGLDGLLGVAGASSARRVLFNAGACFGIAVLLAPALLVFVPFLFVGIAVLRSFKPAEWAVALLGLATPLYFAACLYFLADNLPHLTRWPRLQPGWPLIGSAQNARAWIGLAGAGLLAVAGVGAVVRGTARMAISVRRAWVVVGAFAVAALAALVGMGGAPAAIGVWIPAAAAAALAASVALSPAAKGAWLGTFIFYTALALLILQRLV